MSSSPGPLESSGSRPAAVPTATVHVDLDGAQDIFEGHGWDYSHSDDPVFETGMRHFLDFFASNRVTATFFVTGRSVRDKRKRPLIEEAVRAGHEIASHSLTHRYLTRIDTTAKRQELGESRDVLEQALGVPVVGFRAPGYRIDRESLELLAEFGYAWDSSVFPTAKYAAALETPVDVLAAPHEPVAGSPMVEWPMPDHRPFPLPFNPSYALILGDWLFRRGIKRYRANGRPLTLLFHLIDLAAPLPSGRLRGLSSRIFTLSTLAAESKRVRCQAMLELVKAQYRIMLTGQAIAEWRRNAIPATSTAQSRPAHGAEARAGGG
ncbi:MAG: polysaccharide deacetylase family protein [Gemmatimonadetes bacterium]|nr:polysaccharide deacetylase family protein [Gemmatimonadota bacterium]MCC6774004.1 polysaccharide deacetylase family protein [Gemmatimonadaceae bacterium]